jgi:hypothetical protein
VDVAAKPGDDSIAFAAEKRWRCHFGINELEKLFS